MSRRNAVRSRLLLIVPCLALTGCAGRPGDGPSIRFTRIPPADKGGPDTLDVIEGRVAGAQRGQRIVVFAKSGVWWVQPEARQPFTEIRADSTWRSSTHLGTEYAALLVDAGYRPPLSAEALPKEGGGIVAVAIAPGDASARAVAAYQEAETSSVGEKVTDAANRPG